MTTGIACLWDLRSRRKMFHLPEERSGFWSLNWSPNSELIVVGLTDGSLSIWSLPRIRAQLAKSGLDWEDTASNGTADSKGKPAAE
jgi:WD40 repeat protein